MSFPLSEVLSGAALLLAVASPIITSAINSHAQKREREAIFYTQRQAEVFEKYLQTASAYISAPYGENINEFGEARGKILLFVDDEATEKILKLDKHLAVHDHNAKVNIPMLVSELSEISTLLLKKYPRLVKSSRKRKAK